MDQFPFLEIGNIRLCKMEYLQDFIEDNFSNELIDKNSQDSYGYFYETPQPPENINNYGDYLDVTSPMLVKCKDEIVCRQRKWDKKAY